MKLNQLVEDRGDELKAKLSSLVSLLLSRLEGQLTADDIRHFVDPHLTRTGREPTESQGSIKSACHIPGQALENSRWSSSYEYRPATPAMQPHAHGQKQYLTCACFLEVDCPEPYPAWPQFP